jgi:hypothetical protein
MIEWPLLVEFVCSTRSAFNSVKKIIELSRDQFTDKRFGEVFYRMVTKEMEKTDYLMDSLLNYIRVSTPIQKAGTVQILAEEALKKFQARLDEKKVRVTKEFERDLPETIVPDEQLRYIFGSLLQYVVTVVLPGGSLRFSTKSSVRPAISADGRVASAKEGRTIEILFCLTGIMRKDEPRARLETMITQEGVMLDFQLRLLKEVVSRNQGILRFEVDEERRETLILLHFPVERRKIVYYQENGLCEKIDCLSPRNLGK